MEIKLKWRYAEGTFDTKTMELISLPARAAKHEKDAEICIQTYNENGSKGWNLSIAEIHLGDIESSNALAAEIVRRFNEFPEELKK